MSDATIADKRSRLQTLLKSSNTEYLQKTLLSALPKASEAEIDVLLTLVSPLAAAANTKLHCVRCHKSFFEHANHAEACRIKHDERGDGERTEVGRDDITVTEACCGIEYDMEDGPPSKWCIVTEHTTRVEEVDYYDEENDDWEGNALVVTCAQKGCSKKRKKAGGGGGTRKVAKK